MGNLDARTLCNLPAIRRPDYIPPPAERRMHREVRRWRHRFQAVFCEWMFEFECLTRDSVRTGKSSPFSMSGTASKCLMVSMSSSDLCRRLGPDAGPSAVPRPKHRVVKAGRPSHHMVLLVRAMGSKRCSRFDVKGLVARGFAKLWWLPAALLVPMRRIGVVAFIGGDTA